MKKILTMIMLILSVVNFWFSFVSYAGNVKWVLSDVAQNRVGDKIDDSNVKGFMENIAWKIIMPIVIVIWLMLAFVGFYKLAFSDKEDERKVGMYYALWWTIWVVVMTSAWFLVSSLVWNAWSYWIIWSQQIKDPVTIAAALYGTIIKKFFILAMYFVIWILFIILVINLIKFISSWDKEDVKKHAKTIVIWNSIWIIFIMFAKNIVEMFYTKVSIWSTSLWSQNAILATRNISWLSTVLNYFLWFVAFIITVFIIYQSFLLLMKPDDEATYKNLKKYFIYATLWVLLMWGVYIIANFFIIN